MSNILHAISYGGTVAVIGMLIVFFALALLIVIISLLANALNAATNRKKAETPAPAPAPVAAPAPVVEEPVVEEAGEVVDDAELIAVIAAAIAAFDNSGKTLVVRKVRRVSAWNKSSRQEQVTRF